MTVYFIATEENGPIKIGWTDGDPRRRLSELQVGTAKRLFVLATLDGGFELEQALHTRFAPLKIRGEWYESAPELVEFVESCADYKSFTKDL